MGKLIGITGTPGTGKKTIAPLVASRLGLPCSSLNEIAESFGLVSGKEGDLEADTEALRRKVTARRMGPSLVYGHLLPYVIAKSSISSAIVLRCEPSVLKRRLLSRGYLPERVVQNVEAELIGLIASDAYSAYGRKKTAEFDTTGTNPGGAAESIVRMIRAKDSGPPRIDWEPRYDLASKLRSLLAPRSPGSAFT